MNRALLVKHLVSRCIYDITEFIQDSIEAVQHTLFEALIIVSIVVIVFLQTWRAAVIPLLAIPVSLVGTFAVMLAAGFSLNNLSMFGLVLAIGIVVDDDADRVGGEHPAADRGRRRPQAGGARHDGRGRRRADRHRADADRGVRTGSGLYAWEFEKDGRALKVRVDGQCVFNGMGLMVEAALAGFGFAFVPEDAVRPISRAAILSPRWTSGAPHTPAIASIIPAGGSLRQPSPSWSKACA